MISCLYLLKLICLLSNALLLRLFLQLVLTRPQQGRRAHKKTRGLRRIQKTFTHKATSAGLKFDNLRAAAMHINCFALHPCSNGNERWHVLGEAERTHRITQTPACCCTHPKCRESALRGSAQTI